MLQDAPWIHHAKPDKRRMSEEGGKKEQFISLLVSFENDRYKKHTVLEAVIHEEIST